MNIQSHQVESFLTAAQCSSFSKAAEKLFVSPSALQQQITTLERNLGFSLFERSPQGIRLTESGQYFYQGIRELKGQFGSIVEECVRRDKKNSLIRIAAPGDLDMFYFREDLFSSFRAAHENITLEFIPTSKETLLEKCLSGAVDIGFYFGPRSRKHPELLYIPVNHGNLGIYMSRENPLAGKETVTRADLTGRMLYMNDISYHENIYDQVPQIQDSHLVQIPFTKGSLHQKCQAGDMILAPCEYARLLTSLRCVPLDPPVDFVFEFVCRPEPSPALLTFIRFYKEYVINSSR